MSDRTSPGTNASRPATTDRITFSVLCAALTGGLCVALPGVWYLAAGWRADWGGVVALFLALWGGVGGGLIGLIVGAIFPSRLGLGFALAVAGTAGFAASLFLLAGGHELAILVLPASIILFLLAGAAFRRKRRP